MWDVAEVADVDVEVMEEETPSRSTPKEPSRRRFESAPPRPAPTPTVLPPPRGCEEEEGPASSVAPPKSPALERGEESFSARDLLSRRFPTLVVAGAQEEALIALF
jgi:hypothetical protein